MILVKVEGHLRQEKMDVYKRVGDPVSREVVKKYIYFICRVLYIRWICS
jgi:hypothetical protein